MYILPVRMACRYAHNLIRLKDSISYLRRQLEFQV